MTAAGLPAERDVRATSGSGCVLLIGNYPPPYGGVPKHIEYLAPALVDTGFDVHVLSGGDSGVERRGRITIHKYDRTARRKALAADTARNARTWARRLRSVPLRDVYGFLSLASLGRRIIRRHGVTVIKAYNLMLYAPVGAILSAEYNLPLVISSFGEYFKHREFFRRHASLATFMVRQAARRLSMTDHCAMAYRQIPGGSPYEIVPYGVDVDEFHPRRSGAGLRHRFGIEPEAIVLLYLGRISSEMGFAVFAEAVRKMLVVLPSLKIVIGGKPEELYGEARALAAAFPHSVFVRPDVPAGDLPEMYAAADIVAVPTLDDRACGSLSAAEAAASGKPVVASRVGGVPEFVLEGRTGLLVPPRDPDALSAAVLELCADRDRERQMGEASRAFAESHLDVRTTNRRICTILSELSHRHVALWQR